MFLIPQHIPWTQQPQALTKVRPEYSDGVIVTAAPTLIDAVQGRILTLPSTLSYGIDGKFGQVIQNSSQTANAIALPRGITGSSWTGFFVGSFVNYIAPGYNSFFKPESGGYGLKFMNVGGGVAAFSMVVPGVGVYVTSAPVVSGAPYAVTFLGTNGGTLQVISRRIDTGEIHVSTPIAFGTPSTMSGNSYLLSEETAGYGSDAGSKLSMVGFINRKMSQVEALEFVTNPWQIFQPQTLNLNIPVVTGGGGPANITGTLSSTLDSITTAIQGSLGHSSTLSISLDTIAVTGSGVLNHTGTSTSTLDDVVVTFSGAVDTAGSVSGTMAFTLDSIAFSSAGNLSHSTTLSITLDDVFVSLAGTVAGTPENIDGTLSIVLDGIGFTSSGNSGTLTLTEDDINAIMTAIINNPKTLTIPKFLGLK